MLGRAAILGLALGLAGCGAESQPPGTDAGPRPDGGHDAARDADPEASPACNLGFLGEPDQAPQIELLALGADGKSKPLVDGDEVALIFPIQGGRVVFAGVRATNVAACGATLAGALRDQTTKQVRIDNRTVNLVPSGDGWGGSVDADLSSFSNIPLCPNQWSATNVYGTEYELIVTLTDRDERTITRTHKVTPQCAEPEHEQQ